ncbi:MAG: sugar ABC transporter ATP-binding protein [Beutenbergiaceae bacterium]
MEHQTILQMSGIRKSFAGNEVLHGVDFQVQAGQVHALIGHNGAGKSTLMKVLGGVYPDYLGLIEIDGQARTLTSPRSALDSGVAIIYQDFALVPQLDTAHNIALGREPSVGGALLSHRQLLRRSAEEARRFGIDLPMTQPVASLGVAAQQLTEIVRALARDVRILVMDEPTARLSPAERSQLFQIIAALADSGVGIVYISHFLDEVVEIADLITVLRDGAVVSTQPASECTAQTLARELVGDEKSADSVTRRSASTGSRSGPAGLELQHLRVADGPGIDLAIRKGEIVALAGLVGSGRTRLARAIIGDIHSVGSVHIDGAQIRGRNPGSAARAGLLLLPEDRKRDGLVLTSSVRANIELTALGTFLSKLGVVLRRATDQLIDATIRRVRIRPPDQHMMVGALSGGNAQKVLIGRVVAASPKAIIVDQPTAGVDVGAKSELHRQIVGLADGGAAILLISDDLDEMITLADRVLVFVGGQVVDELDPAELTQADLLAAISRTGEASLVPVDDSIEGDLP